MELTWKRSIAVILAVMMIIVFIPTVSFAADLEADDLEYDIEVNEEYDFDEEDFNEVCDDLTGETLDYVYFEQPSSSKGVLYDNENDDELDEDDEYYYDDSPSIDDITFIPEDDYTGTVTIYYTGYDLDDNEFTGRVRITVEDGADADADDLEYEIEANDTLDFEEDDFFDACDDANNEDLDYVKFTIPASSKGVLFVNYDDGDYDSKVSNTGKYYYDDNDGTFLGDITFVPKKDYTGTVTISYKGYDVDGDSFTGAVKIIVEDNDEGDIEYSVNYDDELDFDEEDFNDFCEDENDESLDYIVFPSLPASSKGVLWLNYDKRDEEKVYDDDEYYYDDDPSIDDITFVPNKKFNGNIKIAFEGEDQAGDEIEGTILIKVKNEDLGADEITLTGTAGSPVTMQATYFSNACEDLMDEELDYITFIPPSGGKLYYDYTAGSGSAVGATTKYYYDKKSPYIGKVSFVSTTTLAGSYAVNYTGYDTQGSSFAGSVKITLTAGTTTPEGSKVSKYFKDVDAAYEWVVPYVDTLQTKGVIKGSTGTDGKLYFYPAAKITRADFLLLLTSALNLSGTTTSGNFSDVAAGSYYYDALATAKALGIAQGSYNKFYPKDTITREDAMVLVLRSLNASGKTPAAGTATDLNKYTDNTSVSSYAKDALTALIKAGVITGSDDGKLHPKNSMSRAEAAAIIYRIIY